MLKESLHEMLVQNQITCDYAFKEITEDNTRHRLNSKTASIGFIYRHIGETMNLFCLFFGRQVAVQNTTMGQTDNGGEYDLTESKQLVYQGYELLTTLVKETSEAEWPELVDTPFFGTVPKIRLFSHILYHNSHHAGQISLTLNRGRFISGETE